MLHEFTGPAAPAPRESAISFEKTWLNDGDGMDAESGMFIAPVAIIFWAATSCWRMSSTDAAIRSPGALTGCWLAIATVTFGM